MGRSWGGWLSREARGTVGELKGLIEIIWVVSRLVASAGSSNRERVVGAVGGTHWVIYVERSGTLLISWSAI
jgi:hypothetical protein